MKQQLILLHGALGASKQLEPLKNELSNEFEVYTFDFEGHGGRPSDNSFSIDLFTHNVIDFMSENALESASFFGYSMGGYVALNLAFKNANLVDRIFTYGTKFDWTPESSAKEIRMLNPDIIIEKVPKFADALNALHAPMDWKINMRKTAEMMLDMGKGAKIKDDEFKLIKHPVLIGIGDQDQMVSIEESKNIVSILPYSQMTVFPEQVHMIEKIDLNYLSSKISTFFNT